MAKSDEEFDLCGTSPPCRTDFLTDCGQDCVPETSTLFNWRLVKRRHRHRYTVSHSGSTPPAPPSTPTSLTAIATPTPSPTATSSTNSIVAATTAAAEVKERLNNLFYILDYAPKYKMKINKEQQRTDAELASLLNVITLSNTTTSSSSCSGGGAGVGIGISALNGVHNTPLEHRICAASRTIKKPATNMKIFKIRRNPKWFFREPDHEEDSVSAPEYDDSDEREFTASRYRRQLKGRQLKAALRKRRFAHFQQQERMEALMHDFGNGMTFNEV